MLEINEFGFSFASLIWQFLPKIIMFILTFEWYNNAIKNQSHF